MRKPISCAVAALLFAGTLAATPDVARALSLEDALAAAYVGNPELEAQRASVRATDEQVPQALSGWRPRVQVDGSIGHQSTSYSNGGQTLYTQPRTVQVGLVQPLFRGFRTVNQTSAAENTVLAARSQLTSVEQQILLNVVEAYMNVLRDEAVLELNENNVQVLTRQLDATRDRFRVGEITRTDVSQAEARLAGAVAGRIGAESTLNTTRATFERIVGLPAKGLETPASMPAVPESLDQAVELAIAAQPQVLAAEYQAEAALDSVDVVWGELLPTVNLEAGMTEAWDSSASTNGLRTESTSVLATVTVPLYQSGAVYSRMRQAKHTAGQRRLQVDQAKLAAREAAIQAWDSYKAAQAQIKSITSQVDAANVALEGVQREAQVGARTVLDVLDAEQELLDARVNLVRAQRNDRVAAYSLLSAVGNLTAGALGLPVEIYDPAAHYEDVRGQWFGSSDWADGDEEGKNLGPKATRTLMVEDATPKQ